MDKYLNKFFDLLLRITESLEVIAGEKFKEGQPIVNPVLAKEKAERERLADLAELTIVQAELKRLKIPFAKEMPLDMLKARLEENMDKAEAKLEEEAEAKAKAAAEAAKPKSTPKPKAPAATKPKAEEVPTAPADNQAEEITEEMMKAKLTKLMAAHGDAEVVKFFREYPFKTPALKIPAIAMDERAKFLSDIEANFTAGIM